MAVESCLLTENGTSGTYWANLPVTDLGGGGNYRGRYGAAGSERVYSRIYDWYEYYNANKDIEKSLVLEVQGKWDDTYGRYACPEGFYSITITAMVNGVFDPDSYHAGTPGGGWRRVINQRYYSALSASSQNRFSVIGLEWVNQNTDGGYGVRLGGGNIAHVLNCIITGNTGLYDANSGELIANNLIRNCPHCGVDSRTGSGKAGLYQNNLAIGCGIGFYAGVGNYTGIYSAWVNNVAIGNTTNWWSDPDNGTPDTYDYFLGKNNGGETGDTIWGNSPIAGITTSDFVNFAGNDFRPASASSKLVNSGTTMEGAVLYDIANNVRPNYETGSDSLDIGCFEYDHGNGLAPKTVSIEISGIITGSDLAIYKSSDNTEIVAPTTISSTNFSTTYTYTGDTTVTVKIRNASGTTKYKPYTAQGVIGENGLSMIVAQIEDPIAS